jgi:hypothetical protein
MFGPNMDHPVSAGLGDQAHQLSGQQDCGRPAREPQSGQHR